VPGGEARVRHGLVYLGSGSSNPYSRLVNRRVESAEDLRGLRQRSGGAPFSRWAENFGAVPVGLGAGETFEAMSQGTIEASMASVVDLLSFRLVELATHLTEVPLGTYFSTSNFAIAHDTWTALSEEERAALVRAANRANADFTQRWGHDFPEEARQAARDAGIEFVEADDAFVEPPEAFTFAFRAHPIAHSDLTRSAIPI
jgi:TRAP-type transport system periplasmic protein